MRTLFLLKIVLGCSSILFGQSDPATQEQTYNRDRVYAEANSRSRKNDPVERPRSGLSGIKNTLTKAELGKLKPTKEQVSKYSNFLKHPKSGLIKLFEFQNCDRKLIDVNDEKCLEAIQIIGNASYYSFKKRSYTDYQDKNVILYNGKVSTYTGNAGLIADLGDVEFEKLDSDSKEIKALRDLKLVENEFEIDGQNKRFLKGVEIDGKIYNVSAPLKLNSTYALRSVKYWRSVSFPSKKETTLEEIIVAFKVVNKNDDGSWLLLWRELGRNKRKVQ